MAIQDDFSITPNAGDYDIRYVGAAHEATGAGYYTVIDFHRWLQDIADDEAPATANDLVSIVDSTPSERSTDNIIKLINGYNIDQATSEHLYDGTIIQGDVGVDQIIWDGAVVIAAPDMELQIMQNGAQLANDFWNSVMFDDGGINPNGYKGLNFDVAGGLSHRFMIKVHDFAADGGDIDGRRIIGSTKVDYSTKGAGDSYGKTFSEFKVNGTARGNNVLALTYADDLNDASSAAGFGTITNTEGYREIDVDANSVLEPYYSEWNRDSYSINQFYQRIKYLSRGDVGNVGTLYGLDAKIFRGITHEIPLGNGTTTGTFVEPELVTWATGTGQLLAIDNTDSATATKMWIQILTGVAPLAADITITGAGGAVNDTSGGAIEQTVSSPFCGVSTGSALIGAYGFGVEALDLGPSDTVFDLNGSAHNAPNNVTFTVGGVVSGEDRILVGPDTGQNNGVLNSGQFAITTTPLTTGSTSIIVGAGTETPGTGTQSESDTPNTGTIRVQDDAGVFQKVTYTGYSVGSGSMTFTGCDCSALTAGAAVTNDLFVSYIDALYDGTANTNSYTGTYGGSSRFLFVRVRDGGTGGDTEGIKTFESPAALGSSDSSISAIRTPDV